MTMSKDQRSGSRNSSTEQGTEELDKMSKEQRSVTRNSSTEQRTAEWDKAQEHGQGKDEKETEPEH